jgi:hypothetical protein
LLSVLAASQAQAVEKGEKEPVAIIELGGTAEWAFTGETKFRPVSGG